MSVMICGLILCGLGLEAFRLSMAAGAIQANLSRRKMIWLGGIFAAVQLVLFFLGTGIWLACGNFLPASEKIHILARVSSILFIVLAVFFFGWAYGEKEWRKAGYSHGLWMASQNML